MSLSVEGRKGRFDAHGPPQDTSERTLSGGTLEAREPAAGVDAAAGLRAPGRQHSRLLDETD
jgi:hypothetical protein